MKKAFIAMFMLAPIAASAAVVVKPAPKPGPTLEQNAAAEAAHWASFFPAHGDTFNTGGVNCPAVVVGECHSHPNK